MTQQELAERSSLTLRTIQRIEANEVNPSNYSLKSIGEALGEDFLSQEPALEKPFSFEFIIKINDMNQLVNDLKTLVRNNWKLLLVIGLIIWVVSNYTDIKAGFMDGFNNR